MIRQAGFGSHRRLKCHGRPAHHSLAGAELSSQLLTSRGHKSSPVLTMMKGFALLRSPRESPFCIPISLGSRGKANGSSHTSWPNMAGALTSNVPYSVCSSQISSARYARGCTLRTEDLFSAVRYAIAWASCFSPALSPNDLSGCSKYAVIWTESTGIDLAPAYESPCSPSPSACLLA